MIPQIVKNLFGTRNSRLLKKYRPLVDKINGLEEKYRSFKDIDFSTETERLKNLCQSSNNLDNLVKFAPNLSKCNRATCSSNDLGKVYNSLE